jgi:hypothetical protein
MLQLIDTPVGVDVPIRQLQQWLYPQLMKVWGLDDSIAAQSSLYECYPRCYRNRKDNGYVAEVYIGSGEYKDVAWNDNLNAISFFGIGTNIKNKKSPVDEVDVHLVFFVNIDKVRPGFSYRSDEQVRLDVENIIQADYFGFLFKSVDLGIENVLKEYPGSIRNQLEVAVDMHPVHCFRINFVLIFDNNNCF